MSNSDGEDTDDELEDKCHLAEVSMELFSSGEPVKICAPMVRYSKLGFRNLVRLYDCDLAFSPMIMADSFHMSQGRSCFYNVIIAEI